MYTLQQFAEKYKDLPDHELLNILHKPEQYQDAAVEAARLEMAARNLSSEQLSAAQQVIDEREEKEQQKRERAGLFKQKVNDSVNKVYDELNPILDESPGVEKTIRIISIIYGAIFLYRLFREFRLLPGIISGDFYLDGGYTFYIFPLLLLAPVSILIWKKSLTGWILLCGYCCFFLPIELFYIYQLHDYYTQPSQDFTFIPFLSMMAEPLLHISTLYLLYKKDIIEAFGVDVNWKNATPLIFLLLGAAVLVFYL